MRHEKVNANVSWIHLQTLRRKPRSPQQQLAEKLDQLRQKSFKQIGEVFEKFIPKALLRPEEEGVMSRRRFFSLSSGTLLCYAIGNKKTTSCRCSANKLRLSSRETSSWATRDSVAISTLLFWQTALSTALPLSPAELRSVPSEV